MIGKNDPAAKAEREEAVQLADENPNIGAYDLATRIVEHSISSQYARYRPYLSLVSVIRRHRARRGATVSAVNASV